VQWFDWIVLLGGREFDFFVDPASVSVRYGTKSTAPLFTVWSGDETDLPVLPTTSPVDIAIHDKPHHHHHHHHHRSGKTFAQQVLEDDAQSDDELFAILADEISVPTWMTPILDQFPIPVRSISPLSDISQSSRSSSPASLSSNSFSTPSSSPDYSCEVLPAAFNNFNNNLGSAAEQSKEVNKLSRRERARRARVFVDTTKTTVTPYDGGKTTVLTGGVMLGGAASKPKTIINAFGPTRASSHDWRFSML
jgi:protein Tob/BTG